MAVYAASSKKLLILYILEILQRHTDYDHRLTQQQIIDLLDRDYCLTCERKAVSRNISCLQEAGYDIRREDGYYLAERDFDDSELRLMIDSLLFSKEIPNRQRQALIRKIAALSNRYFEARVSHIRGVNVAAPQNPELFYNVELLDQAISERKQVRFTYNSYGTDKQLHPRREEPYLVNPYQMVAANGRLYLICNYYKYEDVANYRIDRMTNLELVEHRARQVEAVKAGLNLPKHMAEHIYMFSGPCAPVRFRVDSSRVGDVLDWFGDCCFSDETPTDCLVTVSVNQQAMLYWALQYGSYVEILSPPELRRRVAETAHAIARQYEEHGPSLQKRQI